MVTCVSLTLLDALRICQLPLFSKSGYIRWRQQACLDSLTAWKRFWVRKKTGWPINNFILTCELLRVHCFNNYENNRICPDLEVRYFIECSETEIFEAAKATFSYNHCSTFGHDQLIFQLVTVPVNDISVSYEFRLTGHELWPLNFDSIFYTEIN